MPCLLMLSQIPYVTLISGYTVDFPKDEVAEFDPLHIPYINGAAPSAMEIYNSVFVGRGQRAARGEDRAIREDDLRFHAELIL